MPRKKTKKKELKIPDGLTLTLYLITFILMIFGAWYHKLNWILMGFIPVLVALWHQSLEFHL
jgi:uncharacterized membrane protein